MSALREIVVATGNPHKVKEIREILAPSGLVVRSLDEVGGPFAEPDETGRTFEANARIKAVAYAKATGRTVLADDSGLEVDALGGEPGVDSAIWAGADGSRAERDARNNAKLGPREPDLVKAAPVKADRRGQLQDEGQDPGAQVRGRRCSPEES